MSSWMDYLRKGLTRSPGSERFPSQQGISNFWTDYSHVRPFVLRHWRKGLLGACIVLLVAFLSYPIPLVYRYLIDDVILAHQLDKLWLGIALFAVLKFLTLALGSIQQYPFTRFEQAVSLDLQSDLFERLLHFPKAFFDATEIGYLMSRIQQDVSGVQWFFSQTLVYALTSILKFLGGVVFLFYIDWRLALISLLLLPFLVFMMEYFSRKMRILNHAQMEQNASVYRNLQESLSTTTLIKTFSSEKRTLGRMMTEWKSSQRLGLEQVTVSSLAGLMISLLPGLGSAIVFIIGAYLVIQGDWTFGSLIAFQSYLGFVYSPAMSMASTNLQMQSALASLSRISALYGILPEENLGKGKRVEHLTGEIEFKDVSFTYDGREMIIDEISFHVSPGEHIAIIGPSGVGKTTLISLLLQFYRPLKGEILYDGLSASGLELSSLRDHIGYVSQSPMLIEGTIRDNICYGYPQASQDEIDHAARLAGIFDYIESLPGKYESRIGERGVNLSEGQKQRLSIARAIIKNPDILILDEPASSLDKNLEATIFNGLPKSFAGKTLFIIAHQPGTIKNADRILILQDKKLVASGTHTELIESSLYYGSLFH